MNFRKLRKHFSLGMAILFVFTLVPTTFAENTGTTGKIDFKSSSPENVEAKINAKLKTQFKKDEYVTYLVKLKEQTDTISVSKNALQKAAIQKVTPSTAKLSARTSVVSSLRETASRTQVSLDKYLQQEQQAGEVKEYKSYFIVNAMAVTSTQKVMEQIALHPEVEKILPDETRYLQKEEINKDATAVKAPEAVKPSSVEWNIAQINAPEVWAKGIDGTGIVVANLDTGVDYLHPALKAKWRGFGPDGTIVNPELSWYDPNSHAALPEDNDEHGTHTMGTMVGSDPSGTNQIGVAPGAKWIAVRIFNPDTTDSIILDGGQWLLAPVDKDGNLHPELAPDVVNNSWGGDLPGLDEWFRPIVQAWRAAGIFPEFSAGNITPFNPGGPGSVANPANYPESIATGATDINRNLAYFSLLGPSPYGEIKPEVSAPGVNIRSSIPHGGYAAHDGTSMAGPHTAALAALLLQANHSLTVDQLEEIITSTATPRTDSKYPDTPNNGYGYGIINALNAVNSVLKGLGSVSGRVVTGGDDLEEPVLEHTPPTLVNPGFDIPLTARVTDNVSVTSVEFYARKKGTSLYLYVPASRTSGTVKDGIYSATVPGFLTEAAGVEYYIKVNDYGNNGITSQTYSVDLSPGVKPGYVQDFETGITGFTTGGTTNWAWGTPVSGPGRAYSGQKVFASNLSGTYGYEADSYLLTPPLDLTGSPDGALLSFKQWYYFGFGSDNGTVYVASEDSDYAFVPVATFTGSSGGGWKTQYIDLQPYAGQRVYVQFVLTSDNYGLNMAGWYIDDISLQAPDTVAPAAPADLTGSANFTGNADLSWSLPDDEDVKQYTVYRSTAPDTGYKAIGTTASAAFSDMTSEDNTTYYYAVTASDYAGNESAKSNVISFTVVQPTTVFSDNFDGPGNNGWTHSGSMDEWERGVPSELGPTSAVSAPNVWGTDLNSEYENNADASLVSPVIDLKAVTNATLVFDNWFELETSFDYGYVEISLNRGNTWKTIGKFTGLEEGKKWSTVNYNLNNYVGREIMIRVRMNSDSTNVAAGWYIDNVRVVKINGPETEVTPNIVGSSTAPKTKVIHKVAPFKLTSTSKAEYNEVVKQVPEGSHSISSLPLPAGATVTVVETGRSVATDPATGRYSFKHLAGNYTLKAEAYGYYPQTIPVTIVNNEDVKANFNLQPIPNGQIAGIITDEANGEPIASARVSVLEKADVPEQHSAADGSFSLELMAGTYTLSVTAQDYYSKEITVTVPPNGTVEAPITLKPFIGFPGEIGYDDGTAESAYAFNTANNGWAVRMTPESELTQVTGVSIRFWNTEFPQPGGTAFQYAVYDASGPDGSPGRQLAGPFDGTALRNDQWTTLQLPAPITVQGDFFIVYFQTQILENSPAVAADASSPSSGRSWIFYDNWSPAVEEDGNFMIRAIVNYSVNAPTITSPAEGTFTNQSSITVTGTSLANGATVKLYNGTEFIGTTSVVNGQFSLPAELHSGVNKLSAEVLVNGKLSDRSLPVAVTLDNTAPLLDVISPLDGTRTNSELLNITGTASDEFMKSLTVNGQEVQIDGSGSFAYRMLINAGVNKIDITAKDIVGNVTTVTRDVYVDLALPEIKNLSPAEDIHLTSGGSFKVSFDSAPGLEASFLIKLPLTLASAADGQGSGIPLIETSPGHYEATYVTPSTLVLEGALIVINVRDAAGNQADLQAPGRLFIAAPGKTPARQGQPHGDNPSPADSNSGSNRLN